MDRERLLVHAIVERLLRAEVALRRRRGRRRVAVLVTAVIGAVAVADAQLWPGVSLAFGYTLPIALAAYVFGARRGSELAVLCVILRRVCAGRAYGAWWLYTGSALMLAEYLMLAVGLGLLGHVVRRLARQTRLLRDLSEYGQRLTTLVEPEAILRQAVETSVTLTGADGGFVATARAIGWGADAVLRRGEWRTLAVAWRPPAERPWTTSALEPADPARSEADGIGQLDARVQLAVPVPGPAAGPHRALVVFRGGQRPFTEPTREVLELFAQHVAAALNAAALYRVVLERGEGEETALTPGRGAGAERAGEAGRSRAR